MSGNSLGNLGIAAYSGNPAQAYNQALGNYNGSLAQQSGASLAQQQHQQAYGIAGLGQQMYRPQWMIDGREMSIQQFANELFGEDTPEKTMFLLKYSK